MAKNLILNVIGRTVIRAIDLLCHRNVPKNGNFSSIYSIVSFLRKADTILLLPLRAHVKIIKFPPCLFCALILVIHIVFIIKLMHMCHKNLFIDPIVTNV